MKYRGRNVAKFRDGDAAVSDPDQEAYTYEVHPHKASSMKNEFILDAFGQWLGGD